MIDEEILIPKDQKKANTLINEIENDTDPEEGKREEGQQLDNSKLDLKEYKLIELEDDAWMLIYFDNIKRETVMLI